MSKIGPPTKWLLRQSGLSFLLAPRTLGPSVSLAQLQPLLSAGAPSRGVMHEMVNDEVKVVLQ